MKAHRKNSADFRDLDYAEQAKSINAQLNNIHNCIKVHVEFNKMRPDANSDKLIKSIASQISRMMNKVLSID